MAAFMLGVLTWLYLGVSLVSCSKPCCSDDMPMVPDYDSIFCEDNSSLSLWDVCDSWTTVIDFKETDNEVTLSSGYKTDEYCTGTIIGSPYAENHGVANRIGKVVAFLCASEEQPFDYFILFSICQLISAVFLFITLVFYLLLPELRDPQGKCMIFLVSTLALGCVSYAVLNLPTSLNDSKCVLMAMTAYFWRLCAFFWLNINCFNIWRSSVLGHINMSEQRIMLYYHIAGWGFPVSFLAFALITHHMPGDDHIKPNFGITSCWFGGTLEGWVYFYFPVAVLLVLNFIYFISTARMLWKEYRTPNPLPRIQVLRFKFCIYIKMFLIMGITWIFDLHSAFNNDPWYVTDIINCLQGVTIFLVMIMFRKRVWKLLAAKEMCGAHRMNWGDALVDQETLEGAMEQQTIDDNRTYSLVENGTRQHGTNSSG